tara:strand:- start:956 stop:1141 length:186 start_codon:yes stop_codon:yes gene_type:complete
MAKSKSRVNESGNYTEPGMRKRLYKSILGRATHGTAAGKWSARKAQLLAKEYKKKGGGYKS